MGSFTDLFRILFLDFFAVFLKYNFFRDIFLEFVCFLKSFWILFFETLPIFWDSFYLFWSIFDFLRYFGYFRVILFDFCWVRVFLGLGFTIFCADYSKILWGFRVPIFCIFLQIFRFLQISYFIFVWFFTHNFLSFSFYNFRTSFVHFF